MSKSLVDLTTELLNGGVFNHLPDNEISRLRGMIPPGLKDDQIPVLPLLSYWYRGEYYSSQVPPRFLLECNECLQQMGQPLIDVYGEELYEA